MKKFNLDNYTFNGKEELKTFFDALETICDKLDKIIIKDTASIKKMEDGIEKKRASIDKLNETSMNLSKKIEEFADLKTFSKDEIADLEDKKKAVTYSDKDVQKLEIEDIEASIQNRKSKVAKIDEKIASTKGLIQTNNEALKTAKKELEEAENTLEDTEEANKNTENISKLLNMTLENLNSNVLDVLNGKKVEAKVEFNTINDVQNEGETNNIINDESFLNIDLSDFKKVASKESDTAEKVNDNVVEDEKETDEVINDNLELNETLESENENDTLELEDNFKEEEVNDEPLEDDLSIIDLTELEEDEEEKSEEEPIPEPANLELPGMEENELAEEVKEEDYEKGENQTHDKEITLEEAQDFNSLLKDVFDKEVISFNDFPESTRNKMLVNADKVIKNVVVLKKHQVPLELTLKEPNIYFGIEAPDLDDLFNIITTDEDGNGMGFTIDYTYYVLDELSTIDVDKLIEVYNNEFMNINAKSGLINLLKLTNPDLKDFENNRQANVDTLKSLGVSTSEDIKNAYPEFINLDNPLFIKVLNMFDKDDLVAKMNKDISVINKIFDYWKNN